MSAAQGKLMTKDYSISPFPFIHPHDSSLFPSSPFRPQVFYVHANDDLSLAHGVK